MIKSAEKHLAAIESGKIERGNVIGLRKLINASERKERITKKEWYALGGFANRDLFRKQSRGGAWRYYRALDNEGKPE